MATRRIPVDLAAIQREKARRHLRDFVRLFWPVIEPGNPLIWGWPLDAICDHLEAVSDGRIRNLLINCPPRFLKSTIVSVMWPAWEWLRDPRIRFLTASYDKTLAVRDAVKSRRILLSPLYLQLNRQADGDQGFMLSGDQNVKSRYENNRTGHRICTSPGSAATGEGGDRILVDDPHPVKEAESDEQRKAVIDWWDQTMSTRRNDPKTAARVVIMQRLHEGDLAGDCIEKGTYDHLCLPLLYESDHPHPSRTALGFVDPRTEDGELLLPERIGPEEAEELKKDLKIYSFVGQMQQRPAPSEGGIFQREWFDHFEIEPPLDRMDRVITSWDATFKGKRRGHAGEVEEVKNRSYVVGQVWAFAGAHSWLLDEARGQWDVSETIEAMKRIRKRWPMASAHLVEDKANGPAIETLLRDTIPGIVLVSPRGSKIQRALAIQTYCKSGNVHIPPPSHAPWVGAWIHEITTFPFARNDDRVDAMTQALIFEHVDEYARHMRALTQMVG